VPTSRLVARIKTDEERGPVGAWAYHARDDADLSDEQVVEALARKGHRVTSATIRGIEGGTKKGSRKLLRLMGEVYGSRPPGEPVVVNGAGSTDLAAVVAILERQVAAAERQAAALEALVAYLIPREPVPDRESAQQAANFRRVLDAVRESGQSTPRPAPTGER